MKILANIIWFIFGGFFIGMTWIILGLLLCLTIIGIPFGKQCFKAARLTLAPFGKTVITHFDKHPIANIIWVIFAGWELAAGYFFASLLCCVTIVGIPFGLQGFKLMTLAFCPFGAEVK
jgi:uncharacterized membrane protein YccF (DUF307 family)